MMTIGKPIVHGNAKPLPLQGFPPGKYRIRLRANEWAKVFVKTPDGIKEFAVEEKDGKWTPGPEMARNSRVQCAEAGIQLDG